MMTHEEVQKKITNAVLAKRIKDLTALANSVLFTLGECLEHGFHESRNDFNESEKYLRLALKKLGIDDGFPPYRPLGPL